MIVYVITDISLESSFQDPFTFLSVQSELEAWTRILASGQGGAILSSCIRPLQSPGNMRELLYAPTYLTPHYDVTFYGNYMDNCSAYTNYTYVTVNDHSFPLAQTFSPHGSYAYYLTPQGARKLLAAGNSASLEDAVAQGILTARTYTPPIFQCEDNSESSTPCAPSSSLPLPLRIFFLAILVTLAGIFLGVLLYMIVINTTFDPYRFSKKENNFPSSNRRQYAFQV